MPSMCPINMNDAVKEGVKGISLAATTDCQCHARPATAPVSAAVSPCVSPIPSVSPSSTSPHSSAGSWAFRSDSGPGGRRTPPPSLPPRSCHSSPPPPTSTNTGTTTATDTGGMVVDLLLHHHRPPPQCGVEQGGTLIMPHSGHCHQHQQLRMVASTDILTPTEIGSSHQSIHNDTDNAMAGDRQGVFGCPQPEQIALLPVRLASDSVVGGQSLPIVTVTAGGPTGVQLTNTAVGHHCACCRYNRDSGFSDDASCDSSSNSNNSVFQLITAPVLSLSPTSSPPLQQNITAARTGPISEDSPLKRSSHITAHNDPSTVFQYFNNNIGQDEQMPCEHCQRQCTHGLRFTKNNIILRHNSSSNCGFCSSHSSSSHNKTNQANSSSTKAIYENATVLQQRAKSTNIPRIVCHSPALVGGDGMLKSSVDSGISSPTLPDTQSLGGGGGGIPSMKPDLQHSKSLQDEDLSAHQHSKRSPQLAHMAGGHLSILQTPLSTTTSSSLSSAAHTSSTTTAALPQHRHSTGNVLESLHNKLNSIAHTPSSTITTAASSDDELVTPTTNTSSRGSDGTSTRTGCVRVASFCHGDRSALRIARAPNHAHNRFTDLIVPSEGDINQSNNKSRLVDVQLRPVQSWTSLSSAGGVGGMESNSEDSSSARTAFSGLSLGSSSAFGEGSDLSCDPWGAGDLWLASHRSSSPSGGESSGGSSGGGDGVSSACSGSSDISWAMDFAGAAENASDWKTLKVSTQKLSKCGFYYEHMSMEQAKLMLKALPVGSFLLRDSSNKKYLFSLSAKTPRGVTSVRIEYRNALFRLDSDEKSQSQMPGFNCVLKLIQYYVQVSEDKRTLKCVWLESSGRKDTPVMLTKPAILGVPSLTHLCRKVIHRNVPMDRLAQNLKTDFTLLQYLKEYPYYI